MIYITFDAEGTITGCYRQELSPAHESAYLVVSETVANNWYSYRMNADHTAVELIPPAPPPTPEEDMIRHMQACRLSVQILMDNTAKVWGYDDMLTAVTYADEPIVARYQTDGQALRAWRSTVWDACEQIFADVQAETRTAPTVEELLLEIPQAPEQTPP